MEITNVHLEQLAPILNTLGEIRHPMLAYKVALLQQQVTPVIEAIAKARTPVEEYQVYLQKRDALCQVHAEKDAVGNAKKERVPVQNQQGWATRYVIPNMEKFVEEAAVLEKEYEDALEKETVRQTSLLDLLTSPAGLEFKHKIKYSWCKDALTGNSMSLLMACGILDVDEDLEDEPVKPALTAVDDEE